MAGNLGKRTTNSAPLKLVMKGSVESPAINPAIIIKNWGNRSATLSIDGKIWQQGEDFRQGIRKGPDGDDLIIWIKLSRQSAVNISLGTRKTN